MKDRPADWLTPQQVGNLVGGFSAQFIRNEIKAGELQARYVRSRGGKMGYYRVTHADALVYLAHLLERSLAPTKPASVTGPTLIDICPTCGGMKTPERRTCGSATCAGTQTTQTTD